MNILKSSPTINPIKSSEYLTAAKRPLYSVLNCDSSLDYLNKTPIYWKDGIKEVLREIKYKN